MAMLTLQPSFVGGELAPALSARVDLAKYNQGCSLLKNFKVQPHGGATKRPGFLLLDDLPGEAHLVRFVFNQDQAYCLAFGQKWLRVFTPKGPVLNGAVPYQIATPYTLAQAKTLSVAQSADVLFIACEGVAPQKLKRLDHAKWEFEAISFDPPLLPPMNVTTSLSAGSGQTNAGSTPYSYGVTSVDKDGRESELSEVSRISGPGSNNWVAGSVITVSWEEAADAVEYRLYKSTFGGRPGFVAVIDETTYKDYNVAAVLTEGPPKFNDPFPKGDYPRVVSFFEQRLVFASSPNRPQTIWMSKSGDYSNFATFTPAMDDSPWEGTIASSELSRLAWMVSIRSLVVGATMMEWEVSASQGAAFTAKTAKVTPQSYFGSDTLPAMVVGNVILHITRSGAQVRGLKYDFGADSFAGPDLSIMASHLLERHRVTNWTYQQYPDSVIWMVRDDGALLGLTFHDDHEVVAWHQHSTDGEFKSVASIPAGNEDVLFAVVKRAIEGNTRFFMERSAERYFGGDPSLSVFLDCALVYDQPGRKVNRVTGLAHLEGKTVGIFSHGAVEAPKVVAGGAVDLESPSDRVIVGLPFTAELATMPVEIVTQGGATVGRKKHISGINIRVYETMGAEVGLSFDDMTEIKWRSIEPHGVAPKPYSGDRRGITNEMALNNAKVCVRSASPTPMTILAIMADVDIK